MNPTTSTRHPRPQKKTSIVVGLLTALIAQQHLAFPCTTYEMDTPQGPIFGSNLDLFIPANGYVFINKREVRKTGFSPNSNGISAEWVSKYGSVTLNLAGREFPWSGINEAGLTFSTMELLEGRFPEADDRPPLPAPMWAQYVLDTCATLEEVIEVNEKIRPEDPRSSTHFFFSDAQGNCLAIEWLNGTFTYYLSQTLPAKAMANAPYWQGADSLHRQGKPQRGWPNPGKSTQRVAAAHWRAITFNPEYHADTYRYAFDTLTQYVAAGHTKWNVVYDISNRLIMFRSVYQPEVKWLSLSDIRFDDGVHPQMLDINGDARNDIALAFHAYNAQQSKHSIASLCANFGTPLPEGFADEITAHWDTFTKAE